MFAIAIIIGIYSYLIFSLGLLGLLNIQSVLILSIIYIVFIVKFKSKYYEKDEKLSTLKIVKVSYFEKLIFLFIFILN